MSTIYTRKTQIFIILPTGTNLVRGDGVVVLGDGGLGGHATTTPPPLLLGYVGLHKKIGGGIRKDPV